MNKATLAALTLTLLPLPLTLATPSWATAPLEEYRQQAQQADSGFAGFSADRGKAFFLTRHGGGKPDTPACTSCHTDNPRQAGHTRAGKAIEPLAVSVTPSRYADLTKTEKWFRRNCNSVLGRACTALEKGDFITFMQGQ